MYQHSPWISLPDLVNLTPHKITVALGSFPDGAGAYHFPPSPEPARVSIIGETAPVGIVPLYWEEGMDMADAAYILPTPKFGEITGLPPFVDQPGRPNEKGYIVSSIVAQAMKEQGIRRPDVVVPDTGPNSGAIRENGQVVAVRRFYLANW